jgi:hypothetical protein
LKILVYFENLWIGNTRLENSHLYKQFSKLNKSWTLTKQKIVEIQIANNPNHTITKIQYPIQVAIDHTIRHAQS